MKTKTARGFARLLGGAALAAALAASAWGGDLKSIAILTPEQGTDYGWNQQGVEGAKAAAKAADCAFHDGGSPETTIPTVPVRVIFAARTPAR